MTRSSMERVRNAVRAWRQRRGTPRTKQALWDREYVAGRWERWQDTGDDPVYAYLARYARQGSILDLGCGAGNTGTELPPDAYADYTGVDVSAVAVERARARSERGGRAAKNRYVRWDIVTYVPDRIHDVIVFRESMYYLSPPRIVPILDRYAHALAPGGVFLVTLYSGRRHAAIVARIAHRFTLVEEDVQPLSERLIVVFRPRSVMVPRDGA